MNEILRDSVWQFVGVVLAVIAIAVSFVIYFLQRNKKSLTYEVTQNNSLLTSNELLQENFKIYFKQDLVRNVRILVLRIINDGNQPIIAADYERPISLNFEHGAKILSVEVTQINPANLQIEFDKVEEKIIFKPVLLNRKDFFEFKVLLDGSDKFNLDARITGISLIKLTPKVGGIWQPVAVAISIYFINSLMLKIFTIDNYIIQAATITMFAVSILFVCISVWRMFKDVRSGFKNY